MTSVCPLFSFSPSLRTTIPDSRFPPSRPRPKSRLARPSLLTSCYKCSPKEKNGSIRPPMSERPRGRTCFVSCSIFRRRYQGRWQRRARVGPAFLLLSSSLPSSSLLVPAKLKCSSSPPLTLADIPSLDPRRFECPNGSTTSRSALPAMLPVSAPTTFSSSLSTRSAAPFTSLLRTTSTPGSSTSTPGRTRSLKISTMLAE
jgi:hypothetical protein